MNSENDPLEIWEKMREFEPLPIGFSDINNYFLALSGYSSSKILDRHGSNEEIVYCGPASEITDVYVKTPFKRTKAPEFSLLGIIPTFDFDRILARMKRERYVLNDSQKQTIFSQEEFEQFFEASLTFDAIFQDSYVRERRLRYGSSKDDDLTSILALQPNSFGKSNKDINLGYFVKSIYHK